MAWGAGGSLRSCDALLARVERNDPTLTELVILSVKAFGPAEVERLARAIESGANTRLRSLSASGHPLPPESLRRLGRALSSQAEAAPRDAGIASLAVGSKDTGDAGAVALCEGLAETDGGKLEVLDLGWKGLGSEGLRAVGKTFGPSKSLKDLDLSRNEGVGDEGISSLAEAAADGVGDDGEAFASLEALNVAECDVGAAGARSLADLISRRGRSERTTTPLRLLAIGSNPLGAEGCEALAGVCAVPGGPSATSRLHMAGCSAGDGGIVALADAATANPCVGLEVLDLSDNSVTEAGAEALGRSLAESWPDLTELNLAKNELKGGGVASIVGALSSGSDESGEKKNSTLRSLDLSRTDCGAEGAAAALNAGCLASLRLFGNRIGSDGFRSVAPLLRGGHPTLETLDLGGNDAGEGSVAALLRSIADKRDGDPPSKLSVLEIGGNEFGEGAMEALGELKRAWPRLDVAHDKPAR